MSAVLQLGGAIAIVVGLAGTWWAARSHAGWLVCIASSALWLPTLVVGGQWVAVLNVALSMAICLRNYLTRLSPIELADGVRPHAPLGPIAAGSARVSGSEPTTTATPRPARR